MKLGSLRELLVSELKDLYSAENQIVKALPRIIKKVSSTELRDALSEHLEETRNQVQRLDQIFAELEESPRGKKCNGMEGMLEEGKEILQADAEDSVRDAALIAACQRVEHYEIASYGAARTFAQLLGLEEPARLLEETLQEEKNADIKLNEIAESVVNVEAEATAGDS